MKKSILVLAVAAATISAQAQEMKAEWVQDAQRGQYTSYLATDGFTYKIGDTLTIGAATGGLYFVNLTTGDRITTPVVPAIASHAGSTVVIKAIQVQGTKRTGNYVMFKFKSFGGMWMKFENAVSSGEVVTKGMTSARAMAELKNQKDKLDLGLITQEQYNAKKDELVPYIK